MRIALLSNWFPPITSGSSYYTSSLARALATRGHEVMVVTLDWGPEYEPPKDLGFPVHRLPTFKVPKLSVFYNLQLMGFAFTPGNVRRLKSLLGQHRAQILHHVNHIFDTNFLSTRAAHAYGIPVVGSITTPIQHQNPLKHRALALADRMTVGRFGVCRWDGVVCLDQMVREYVTRQYGESVRQRSVVIPFGVRWESMSQYESVPASRPERPQILMVGHVHPFRNPVQLVRAMPLVLKEVPKARLVLAGRVDLQEPVEAARELGLTEDQVRFLGPTPHNAVVELMKTSHVYASYVTGPYPGLGTAPMEAMLCRVPVLNDLPEDLFGEGKLKNGENIVLVNSRDPNSIAAALIRLLKNEDLRQRIGFAGRKFVLEHLSWEGISAQMEQFYEHICSQWGTAHAESPDQQKDLVRA
jgi:glycosyltransferase involved in cell wall biosynthesis